MQSLNNIPHFETLPSVRTYLGNAAIKFQRKASYNPGRPKKNPIEAHKALMIGDARQRGVGHHSDVELLESGQGLRPTVLR